MIPVGYMAKRVGKKPDRYRASHVVDIYSVSNCNCEDFADYIKHWKHNGFWFFDSPDIIRDVAKQNSISLEGTSLFYYEAHEMEFDGERWGPWSPEPSFPTNVVLPSGKQLEGFDVVGTNIARMLGDCHAAVWQPSFIRIIIVCFLPLMRPRKVLTMGNLKTPSLVHTAYSLCIR
jgi:hypothetical protein